jgi:uncharacterized membrane protein HdeD (DUF308 family)
MNGHTNKLVSFVIGILLIVAGLVPLLQGQGVIITFLPENLLIYQIATIILGLILIVFAFKRRYRRY